MMLFAVNHLAVLVSAAVFFVIGSLWYSPWVMNHWWIEELKRNHVSLKVPTQKELSAKMLLTFIANFVASWKMAVLVSLVQATTWYEGMMLGLLVGVGFSATTLAMSFIWQSKTFKLFAIEIGYLIIGFAASGALLAWWR